MKTDHHYYPVGSCREEPQGRAQGCPRDSYYPVTGRKLIESAGSEATGLSSALLLVRPLLWLRKG